MAKAGEAIGIIGGILGIGIDGASLLDTIFPSPPASHFSNFRVHVGLTQSGEESRNTGGHAPALAGWDGSGRFVGQDTPEGASVQKIKDGGFRDYKIEGTQGVEYLAVSEKGVDGICIHLIAGQSAKAGKYAWIGDVGKTCGAPWYNQNAAIDDANKVIPPCVWIDRNADNDHIWKGFTMHLGSFIGVGDDEEAQNRTKQAFTENPDLLCASEPRFSMYEEIRVGNSIRFFKQRPNTEDPGTQAYRDLVLGKDNWLTGEKAPASLLPQKSAGKGVAPVGLCAGDNEECMPTGPSFDKNLPEFPDELRKARLRRGRQAVGRSANPASLIAEIKKRQLVHADRLIISRFSQHSAIELCESLYSLGPDMVSVQEGMFCDMSEKRLWPVCASSDASYCFDMESETVRGSGGGGEDGTAASNGTQALGIASLVAAGQKTEGQGVAQAVPAKSYAYVDTWGPPS